MNDEREHELDPMERLRAADPAAGVEPGTGFVDGVLARTADAATGRGADAASALPGASEASAAPPADLAAERSRRRNRWIPLVAVAASLVVFGGAGYALGATAGAPTDVADGAAPPISLQGVAGGGAAPGVAEEEMSGDAATDAKMSAQGAAEMMYPYGSGRNSFHSSGLSTESGSGVAYAYDPRAASNAETVGALAAAFGVEGALELKDGAWYVGPQDGTAATLYVGLDGTLSFSYFDPELDPYACDPGTTLEDGTGGTDAKGVPCEPSGTAPSEDAAISALRSLITAAGRDADGFEYTSETWEGAVMRSAFAWPIVDGQRLDQSWSAEVSEEGVVNASGALAELVTLGDYDLVSEQQAFERLSDPRFGAQMTALPFAERAGNGMGVAEQWTLPTEPPATPTSGASVAWPVNDVEIVSARLGLASQWQPDGSVLQVPAYEFTDAEGGTWSVIAVADAKLDFAPTE